MEENQEVCRIKDYLSNKFPFIEEENLDEFVNYCINEYTTLDRISNLTVVQCELCGKLAFICDCHAEQYWTSHGDRCVYHECPNCNENFEKIDFKYGNQTLSDVTC